MTSFRGGLGSFSRTLVHYVFFPHSRVRGPILTVLTQSWPIRMDPTVRTLLRWDANRAWLRRPRCGAQDIKRYPVLCHTRPRTSADSQTFDRSHGSDCVTSLIIAVNTLPYVNISNMPQHSSQRDPGHEQLLG